MSNYHASGVRFDDGHSVRTLVKFKMVPKIMVNRPNKTWEVREKRTRDVPPGYIVGFIFKSIIENCC